MLTNPRQSFHGNTLERFGQDGSRLRTSRYTPVPYCVPANLFAQTLSLPRNVKHPIVHKILDDIVVEAFSSRLAGFARLHYHRRSIASGFRLFKHIGFASILRHQVAPSAVPLPNFSTSSVNKSKHYVRPFRHYPSRS